MPTPIHVAAYELFNQHIEDHLEASIAFTLFLVSEREWADGKNPTPTEAEYATFHSNYLIPHEIGRYHDAARRLLAEYGNTIVETKRQQFLENALAAYQASASRGHRSFRFWGVTEATLGALFWTVLLIVFSLLLAWGGIDIFEYYHKAMPPHE